MYGEYMEALTKLGCIGARGVRFTGHEKREFTWYSQCRERFRLDYACSVARDWQGMCGMRSTRIANGSKGFRPLCTYHRA